MHIDIGLHGYGFQHCVHTTYPHFRGCLTALVMREGVEIADDELARFMTRQCHADQHPMFLVYQINGDRPLLTPEDVVPNFFHPHPPLHLLEVIRPLRICTAERTEKKGVKCVKRSARVSTCTIYLLRPKKGWSMAKDATLSRRVVMTTRSCLSG